MRDSLPCLVLVFAFAPVAFAQQDFSKVEVKVEKVAGTVYLLTGAGGNIGVSVGEDGVLIVDDQYAPLAPRIKEAIKGVTDKPIRFVLNTHWHADHTGGNQPFGAEAPVIAHDNVRKRLAEGSSRPIAGRPIAAAPREALPVITFDHALSVHVNGEDIRALHYARGHTDGDSIVFFPVSNVLHMGDDFVTYGLPFVDVASGGTLRGMVENVEKAMAAVPDDVKVIPGHGPLSTKPDVKKFTDMLRDCIRLVDAAMKKGWSLERMKQENVLAPYEELGKGFVKTADFVELIYNELKGEPDRTKQSSRTHH